MIRVPDLQILQAIFDCLDLLIAHVGFQFFSIIGKQVAVYYCHMLPLRQVAFMQALCTIARCCHLRLVAVIPQ